MHIRRRMTYASAIVGLFTACTTALALVAGPAIAAPTLTGRANVDFAVPGAFALPDDSIGRDVGLPQNAPLGTVSGWDMSFLRMFYDPATDVLYVGLQTFGIGGDADGDGDEGTTSLWLASVFGADLPVWDDTESFALMLDTDEDGTFDVIAGVPSTGDVTTYTVAQFDGLTSLPGFAFGAPLGDQFIPADPVVGPASFVAPHIEFRIAAFSQLPGFNGTVGSFRVKAFMGSLEDSGIGEDRIPNGNDASAQVCFDTDQDGYSTCDGDCDDSNASASPGNLGDPLCDLVDEDCDGKLDEDFGGPGVPTNCGFEPVCQAVGFLICTNGIVSDTCVPGENGVFVPTPTSCGVGACAATGTTTCATGSVTDTCTPGVPAPVDGCNGVDDDCDGATDEGFVPAVTSCGVGVCARQGLTTCVAGVVGDTCVPGAPAQFEVCNALDDNCNGATDEGPVLPAPPTCGLGECVTTGTIACVDGEEVGSCTPPAGTPEFCDGLDNDCDGTVDNDPSLPLPPSCGVGECATVGTVACVGGGIVTECTPPLGTPELCDGLDNDCNGSVDDGIAPVPTSCGTGACAATGELVCTGGALVDTCAPGAPSAEVCDGVDNNCEGSVDEGIAPTPTSCGTGACAATGELVCTGGALVDTCAPGAPSAEVCDGVDNNCDGSVDEGIAPTPTSCGTGACAATGELVCTGGALVDTCAPGAPSAEVCDGVDNNCDGSVDEGIAPTPTSCGTGACAATGELVCTGGALVDTCAPGAPSAEVCDGVDNNCDGSVDEGIAPTPTSCGTGACAATGELVCTGGALVDTCAPGAPSAEVCDGVDNNCDGSVDEGIAPTPTSCGAGNCVGAGELTCVNGVFVDTCVVPPGETETCNGTDDNCNGQTDEGTTGIYYTVTQGTQSFQISPIVGTSNVAAFYGYDSPNELSSNTGLEASNRSVVGLYRDPAGILSLIVIHDAVEDGSGGEFAMSVSGLDSGSVVVEDDPSGAPDVFGNPNGEYSWKWPQCCTDGVAIEGIGNAPCFTITPGAAAGIGGIDLLTGGAGGERIALNSQGAPFEICAGICCESDGGSDDDCDAVDNDCDGETDESFVGGPTSCGAGTCASNGQIVCVNGATTDTCNAGQPTGTDADCNAADDDCDGSTDESFVPDATSCGTGACASTGVTTCTAGVVDDTCVVGTATGGDDECDATDNDCDGSTDESFVGVPTSCGAGACASTGVTTCVAGVVGDTCNAGAPGAVDACDGSDNDCDGATDEDFVSSPTACGAGACASAGNTTCTAGVIGDTCSAGSPTGGDADCDATDNDCDGSTDESFVSGPTACGVGACAATGNTTCTAGVIGDTCTAGGPTGGDADCDATDNDCDGSTDESFVSDPTTCGVGACAATGNTTCTAGVIGDTCAAGGPTGGDADCDATDNDCDGATDESFVSGPTSCGVGACAATGNTTCTAGVIGDTCAAGGSTGGDADCDATDNDCDGSTDESFVSDPTTCGVGACAATGNTTCTAGVIGDTCTAGSPTGGDADCDATDNDCDGATDESFVSGPTSCGVGACAATGNTTCTAGVIGDTCTAGGPTGGDADCDATDNDCDGSTDESFVSDPTTCGVGACAATGNTTCTAGVIGDTCAAGGPTGGDADCDATDNDCDGSTDESFVGSPTSCGSGACAATGETTCVAGVVSDSCAAGTPGSLDGCDGADNDCDGTTDESFVPDATTCGTGVCASTGATTCVAGVVGDSCDAGSASGSDADCDNTDNDCDGATDESFVGAPTSCGTGVCAAIGTTVCIAGAVSDTCAPGAPTGRDTTCNNLDDDCDGSTDEGYVGVPTSCGTGVCAATGSTVCSNGVISDTCKAGPPSRGDQNCDGLDDDCDGATDEGFTPSPTACGAGVCASVGATTCVGGVVGDSCDPSGQTGRDNQCDGSDNDCDGSTDESFVNTPTTCGTGACVGTGELTCVGGVLSDSCKVGAPGVADVCDNTDNDCDGSTDEDFVAEPTMCGQSICTAMGMTTCIAGVIGDSCTPGTPGLGDPFCDGVDEDCDGQTDEDFGGLGIGTTCGSGVCESTGIIACINGQVTDTCKPGPITGDDADCDLVDNDCDSKTDESFVSEPTTCGVGICAGSGATKCTNGVVSDSCEAGDPTGIDADCDTTDNDCDGSTDESFVSDPTSCGVGVCAATGKTTCTAGVIGDTCEAGDPTGIDADCDTTDNDCDGSTDESFVSDPTSCGVGVCAATGKTTCTAGVIGDTCEAGDPTGIDADCDTTDNDCDGSTDESFVSDPTSCGVGVCAATGKTTCTAGVIGDTCEAGDPTGIDADCDTTDNDCDGSTDESFVSDPTSCGVGVCAATGKTTCTAGVIGDTCEAGDPTGIDADCDTTDNDCDGSTDESFVSDPTSCGVGVCAATGKTTCTAGVIGDTCEAGDPTGIDADCDTTDNDCDGSTDESFVSDPTSCGVGVCAATGKTTCTAGVIGDTCEAGDPTGIDADCDTTDNDCDGSTDESFVSDPTSCGVGVCAATGKTTCTAGVIGDTCEAGDPTGIDADCDTTDNDCDGSTDESFVSDPTSCGVGVCAATGKTTCTAGVIGDTCEAGDPTGIDADCDTTDNDCDGSTDESFVSDPTACGVGVCAATGKTTCTAGVIGDTCEAGDPTGIDADCDTTDNDCDGATDESFVSDPTSCGVGVCAATGKTTCTAGVIGDTCEAGDPTGIDADCDTTDNDCDGSTDESFVSDPTSCGVGVCAATGKTTCTAGVIGDTCEAGDPTGIDADCDTTDNDCDGSTDESFVSDPTSCGVGVCAATGKTTCTAGVIGDTCEAGDPTGIDADCDTTDNDCDGSTDESFVSDPTSCGVGVCAATGKTTCTAGVIGDTCEAGDPTGIDADCDTTDNDCDGSTDESFVSDPTSCGVGVCAAIGKTTCTAGVIGDTCEAGDPTGIDADCDTTDNDCDGSTDESFVSDPTSCGVGVCAATGNTTCTAGVIGDTCKAGRPAGPDADCDSVDNDCDASTDESFVSEETNCGLGVCAARGLTACNDGVVTDSCVPGTSTGPDNNCDSVDDDCDGATDESFVGVFLPCGVGVCKNTSQVVCIDGATVDTCVPLDPTGTDADCDTTDNDCDGSTDESFVSDPTSCGVGVCAATGNTTCTAGVIGDTCTAGDPTGVDADCDTADNDCDGSTDESFVSSPTSCGVGVCAATGNTTCTAGVIGDTCTAGDPTGTDADCDTADNDCDGSTDESFVSDPTSCGVGVCAATGNTTCTAGVIGDTCTAGDPTGVDADCDTADNDCDGATDESFVGSPTSCGVGVCAATGNTTCTAGVIGDTCTAGDPTGTDADCDTADNDCDGSTDESFVSDPTSCGVGVCAATGNTTCTAGVIGDTCTAGDPTGGDADCDATDNDCDGATDESFVSEETNCGVGACAARGVTTCTAGVIGDTCTAGDPTGTDADCDTADNDCDGSTDESFVSDPTSCGVGVCAAIGNTTCTAGVIGDTCTAGDPTGGDADCDATDNDCDGSTDESFVSEETNCGVGACAARGVTTCTAGVIGDTCTAADPTGTDADCDTADNDCDGSTDESFVSDPTSCGVGVCAATGNTTCTAGVIGDTCTAGDPTGGDADCDATDNDCDGSTDESFVSEETNCGVGVCAARGVTTCTAGVVGDTCTAGDPTGIDADCDATDSDCDGSTDESFVGEETTCGIGACHARGMTSCVDGAVTDSCEPGTGRPDSNCDGVDDDCDGATDEAFRSEPTTCGEGACEGRGMTSCVDGNVTDSCEPGTGRPDSNCDGVDDDCDGATDEAFRSEPTTCGEGVCEGRGMTSCVDGTVTDSCEPGTGQPDSNCDGVDDDCDGSVDESFRSEPTTCGEGACEGRGMTYCADGTVNDTCEAGSGARPDTSCDGVDDDCDGSTDEAFRSSSTTCGDGECYARGMTACVGGAVVDTCEPLDPTTEICEDGIDQDCDGAADNGCECPAPAPGLVYAVASAHSDECHGGSDMHSISLPGFFDGVGSSEALFSFNDDAIFEWSDDGLTARVTGSATLTGADAAHAYELGSEWWVDVVVNYRGAGALGEGSGGPVLALASACQPASLTSAWEYFDMLDGDAVISRMDDPTDFALFTMFPAGGVHPVQVGYAANNKNAGMGLSAGLEFVHYKPDGCVTTNTGALTVDLDCP
jgi:Notch-like protein